MGVAERGQDESERRRRTSVERQHPVGRDAGKQRARVRRRKEARDARGGLQRAPPEPCDGQRVTRYSQRREHCIFEPRPCRDGRANRRAVDRRVRSESSGRCLDRPFQDRGGAVVQRVRDRARRFDPLDAVLAERHRSEERRRAGKRVNGRADVVRESRQRQLGGSHAPADRVARLVDPHPAAGSREDDGRGQAVRPGTDDRRIQVGRHGALSENSGSCHWDALKSRRGEDVLSSREGREHGRCNSFERANRRARGASMNRLARENGCYSLSRQRAAQDLPVD